jgi:predicted short-subunit dehydrogenase-like oxidoreductase (DUF2520 family)
MSKAQSSEKIVFIGAGKVATALALALKSKRKIVQIYSRTNASAKLLAGKLSSAFTADIKKLNADADLYIIAIKDDAIAKIASQLKLKGKTIVHTSGAVSIDVLKKASANCGVLYPPYSFVKGRGLDKNVPFCIEASNQKVKKELTDLVKDVAGKPYYMNSEQRSQLHLAAVFANNFTNHMFVIAHDISKQAHIPFEVLFHLIEDTVVNLKHQKPELNQTGPAKRGDKHTLKKHEEMLKSNPRYLALYKQISKSIQQSS